MPVSWILAHDLRDENDENGKIEAHPKISCLMGRTDLFAQLHRSFVIRLISFPRYECVCVSMCLCVFVAFNNTR